MLFRCREYHRIGGTVFRRGEFVGFTERPSRERWDEIETDPERAALLTGPGNEAQAAFNSKMAGFAGGASSTEGESQWGTA